MSLMQGLDDADRFDEQVRWAAFDRLRAGEATAPADLAADLIVPASRVLSMLGELASAGLVELNDGGEVLGAHGVTRMPTRHALRLAATQLHTWCALDAIGIPAALNADTEMSTHCGWCDHQLTLTINHGVPEAARALVLWVPAAPIKNVREEFCPLSNLFCDHTHLERWRQDTGEPDGDVLTVADAADLGRSLWHRDHVRDRDPASGGGARRTTRHPPNDTPELTRREFE